MAKANGRQKAGDELVRLRAALTAAGDIAYEWDLADDRIVWHGAVHEYFPLDHPSIPATGESLNTRIHPEDLPNRLRMLSDHVSGRCAYDCEYRLRTSSGEFQWIHDRGTAKRVEGRSTMQLLGTLRLVTGRKQNEAQLEYLANYDELTGHFNKHRLHQSLDQALAEALRFQSTGAFVVFGLDQLAMINNAYGPEVGDAVLIEVGHRLDNCLRSIDLIGRIAGDRFGAVLARCDHREAERVAKRAVAEIRRLPVNTAGGPVRVTVSAGVVVFPSQSNTSYDIIARAEAALQQAKSSGRNCVGVYEMTEEQRRSHRASLDIGAEVQQALSDGRLSLAFQPVVTGTGRTVSFYECLLRMHRPDGAIVPAGRFVPVVEQLGLVRAIDRRVLELALDELEASPDIELAINISGLTASDQSWLRALISKVKGRRDIASRLIVEITETAALRDIEESVRFVHAVREHGCRVALDDFGAGYMTFRHMKSLTVDIVKIDGSFVRNVASAPENRLFVRNLLSLAGSLGLLTVAECVENEEEAALLTEEGADLLQGYYFGKPVMERPWLANPTPGTDRRVVPFDAVGQGGGSGG